MAAQDTPYVWRSAAGPHSPQSEHALLGYRIPFLPEGPARPELAALGEHDQARDALASQARAIAALAPYKQGAVALRYVVHPERKTIEVALLVRATAAGSRAHELAASMAQNLIAQFERLRIPTDPITTEAQLREALAPAGQNAVVEIRQREDMVALKVDAAAYVVSPWRPMASAWVAALGAFLSQGAPFVVNVHLEPTQLWPAEQNYFAQSERVARAAAELDYGGLGAQYHIADPQAAVVAELYGDYLQRLREPFLVVVQVASRDGAVARTAAGALAAEISANIPVRSGQAAGDLPCGYDIVAAQSSADAGAAWHTMSTLQFAIWGATQAKPEQQRLRFLADAATASAAFRFPLALRGGLPGITTSRPPDADVRAGQIDRNIRGVS